ncbi:MAG: hypothetical protein CBB97_06750 [Candidatus Endolissoclinum sp. TMED37]|nr:MAG: hypothetical protein CBB97_06750 [Candidatus Endolissoclinum sp. TMED37]
MKLSWIIPIGEEESSQDIIRCFKSLKYVVEKQDEIVIVRHVTIKKLIDLLVSKFDCFIKILDHPVTKTAASSRNIALKNCKYKRIVFQDIDDVPHLNRRQVIQERLIEQGSIVSTGYKSLFDGENAGKRIPKPHSLFFYFRSNIFLPTAAIYFNEINDVFFDDLKIGEDTVFFAKLIHNGYKVKICNEITIDYNISSSKTSRKRGMEGIRNEIKYRMLMLSYTSSIFQKILVIAGGFTFSFLKIFPKKLFLILYKIGHKN